MRKEAWVYVRVKRDDGVLGSDVIDLLVSELSKYAEENDVDVVGWSFDKCRGVGLDRDGLNKAVRAIERGDANTLLVLKADHISRETPEILDFYQRLKRLGAELMSKNDGNVQEALDKIWSSLHQK